MFFITLSTSTSCAYAHPRSAATTLQRALLLCLRTPCHAPHPPRPLTVPAWRRLTAVCFLRGTLLLLILPERNSLKVAAFTFVHSRPPLAPTPVQFCTLTAPVRAAACVLVCQRNACAGRQAAQKLQQPQQQQPVADAGRAKASPAAGRQQQLTLSPTAQSQTMTVFASRTHTHTHTPS